MTKKPDEIVAEGIIDKFKNQGLIEEDKANSISNKLVSGNLSVEDWKLIAELAEDNTEETENGQKD